MKEPLPSGYTSRAASRDDFAGVFAVINTNDIESYGDTELTQSDLRDIWLKWPPEERAIVVLDQRERIVGYALTQQRNLVRLGGWVSVLPEARGHGIGTWLTRWAEERSRIRLGESPEGTRVMLEFDLAADNVGALELLANEGYALERYFLRMQIEKPAAPPSPVWPEGVSVRAFHAGDEQRVYEAHGESFKDHWGYAPRTFESWSAVMLRGESFAPDIWFLAMDGSEIAGISLCEDYPDDGFGWVNVLGVRRPWRRTGVGRALLHHSFNEFYGRGRPGVGLTVDASSLTGATKLYEAAGMHALRRFALCQKELRPGIDISTTALEA